MLLRRFEAESLTQQPVTWPRRGTDHMTSASSDAAELKWAEALYRLRFILGEYIFLTVGFRGYVLRTHFLRVQRQPESARPSWDSVPRRADVVVMPSAAVRQLYSTLSCRRDALIYVPAQYPRYHVDL